MGRLGHLLTVPLRALAEARGILFPWVPVLIGIGVGIWFGLPWEPGPGFYGAILGAACAAVIGVLRGPEIARPLLVALSCVAIGVLAAGGRAHWLAAPVLEFRYYGPVQGRIVMIDRNQAGQTRLTLDHLVLDRTSPARTPARVRVSLHGDQRFLVPEPGMTVILTAHLTAPDGPVEPGGFDFRRMAFFDQLGGVGYTRVPALLLEPAAPGVQRINRLRNHIRTAVEARIAGDPGAFAAALVTGDRAGIGPQTLADLRNSNLAHLLAISGLHMGLLAGFVFAAIRYGLVLVPRVALRVPAKKIAALVALAAGLFYLLLSGGNVATERAFVMVAVMLGAVLFDRRALSLRSVAIAASILLIFQPETMMEPGFQMSFAATVALVAGFGALRGRIQPHRMPRWGAAVFTLVFSSLLAGFATAPIAAAHFNRVAGYGLIANLMAVPVMGTAVMPAAVMSAVLTPLGLEAPALWVMGQGTRWILWVAGLVAGWDGAVRAVPSPTPWVLPMLGLGALWVVLWRGPVRFVGAAPVVAAFVIWSLAERPPILISGDGGLVGLQTDGARALSAAKGGGFTALQWLENDGDMADQAGAAARPGFDGPTVARQFEVAGWRGVQVKGKGAEAALSGACAVADLVITTAKVPVTPPGCHVIDAVILAQTGALAIWPQPDGSLILEPTQKAERLWSGPGRISQNRTVPPGMIRRSPDLTARNP